MNKATALKIARALTSEFHVLWDTDDYVEDEDYASESQIADVVAKAANQSRRGIKVKPLS